MQTRGRSLGQRRLLKYINIIPGHRFPGSFVSDARTSLRIPTGGIIVIQNQLFLGKSYSVVTVCDVTSELQLMLPVLVEPGLRYTTI